jgi:adenylate cyclase
MGTPPTTDHSTAPSPQLASVLVALADVQRALTRPGFDLTEVLEIVLDRAVRLCHADSADIVLPDGEVFQPAASVGFSPEFRAANPGWSYRPERGSVIGRALLDGRTVHIPDVLADPEYTYRDLQKIGGYRSVLGVPLLRDGNPVGVVAIQRNRVAPFTDGEIEIVSLFGAQAAIAIQIASLLTETRAALEREARLLETVERQRTELARFAPQAASLLSSDEGEQLLAGHRRQITALFCDLRGFTAFAETAEPEEVLGVLRDYHAAVGELAVEAGGTVEHFAGDGLMVFFNDPAPLEQHELAAVRTGVAMRERFSTLAASWRKRGYDLGRGIGIAVGYATLGRIGFEGRYDYGAIGNVVITSSRLSDAAEAGQILISQRVFAAVEDAVDAEPIPDLTLKGLTRPVPAFTVRGLRPAG